ncbi:hypothetical protein KUCAC02_013021, partial [Chaenocephalus aceratus]
PGAKACILASKGKALPYKSWWGAGNREVKASPRYSVHLSALNTEMINDLPLRHLLHS